MKMSNKFEITRELKESIRNALGKKSRISLQCPVRMETKGDKTDNKVLVFTAFRLFIMSTKNPSKVDLQLHYLEIHAIESKSQHSFSMEVGDKFYNFFTHETEGDLVDNMILQLGISLKTVFPAASLEHIIKRIDVVPPSRLQNLFEHNKSQENRETGPCGGFSAQYACMCDFHALPYREEVAWDVDTIYLSHDTREISLQDFDHLESRDLIPIISALVYNRWFKKLKISNIRLTSEAAEQVLRVMRKSLSIEELYLDNMGLRWDYIQKLSQSLLLNANSAIHTLDLSNNIIEDKGVLHLVNAIIKLPKGLVHLNLAKTGLTAKGVNMLANGLSVNRFMSSSLTYLNLADNTLKEEVTNLFMFLGQTNAITHLDLSGTDIALDVSFAALYRGCIQKLSYINLSRNPFSHKRQKDIVVPQSFKYFFTNSIGLKYLNLSATKLPSDALKFMLVGLTFNEAAKEVELDLSSNNLGSVGAHVLELCVADCRSLASLDISDNGLETDLAAVIISVGKNKSLKKLAVGRNFTNIKNKYMMSVMEAFVQILQDDDSVIEHLSMADSKLKGDIYSVINALGSNQCLISVDISGNQIGDAGARLLAKALQINTRLKALFYDRNTITAAGFGDLAYALQTNYTMRYMPVPIFDVCFAMKTAPERTDAALKKIENLLHRNVSPKKFSNSQTFRLQQGFLLSSTQQMVDRLVVQSQDLVKTMKQSSMENYSEWISEAEALIKDADKSKQLLTRLHDVVLQREETGNSIEQKLNQVSEELEQTVQLYMRDCVDSMLKCAEDQCPKILNDEKLLEDLKTSSHLKSKLPSTFIHQNLVEQVGADVANKVNELNLIVASYMSDRIVDEVIESLSRHHKSLFTLRQKTQSSTSEVLLRRSRLGSDNKLDALSEKEETLQDTTEIHNKRKSVQTRKLRPQSVVDIPDALITDSSSDVLLNNSRNDNSEDVLPQRLQHLGKARPKRQKTKAPTRNVRTDTIPEDEQILNEGLDRFFQKTDVAANPVISLSVEDKGKKMGSAKSERTKDKHDAKKMKDKSSDNEKEKRGGRFQGLSNMFSRKTSDRNSKSKITEDSTEKCKNEPESMSVSSDSKEVGSISTNTEETNLCQPAAIPKLGVGGNILAEMKARQEKRLSLLRDNPDVNEKGTKPATCSKTPSPTIMFEKDKESFNGFGTRISLSSSDRRSHLDLFSKTTEAIPILKTTASSPRLYTSPTNTDKPDDSFQGYDVDNLSPTTKRSLPPKPKPPPIAPKPRPRSMVSPDFRKSGEMSPGSDVSSLDGSTGTTPERGDMQDDSIDSGLMGSRDSLSPRELTPDPSLSPELETNKRKAASLPRTATPDLILETSSRGRSLSYKEMLSSSLSDEVPHGSRRPISLLTDSAVIKNYDKNDDSSCIEQEFHVDDIVNV